MKIVAVGTVLAAAMSFTASHASAVEYPYCIINGGMSEGSMSCGYQSLAQCMATRVGTDMCVVNPRYQGPQQQRPRGR